MPTEMEETESPIRPTLSCDAQQQTAIAAVIQELRPGVQRDGGDLELVAVEGDKVFVRLHGACTTCSQAGQTLGGVRRRLMTELGIPVRVVPAGPE